MKYGLLVLVTFVSFLVHAAGEKAATMNMNYSKGEDVNKIIEDYSKASGRKIVIDPAVRGRVTIHNPEPVSLEEAFNQLSTALALNGLSIADEGGTMVVRPSRSAQRALIPVVVDEVPSLKPERMVTWIVTLKNLSAEDVMRQVRTLNSRDGEMASLVDTNQLMMSDYTSSIHRIANVIAAMDKPVTGARAKIVASAKKAQAQERALEAKPNGILPNSGASKFKPTPTKSQNETGQ